MHIGTYENHDKLTNKLFPFIFHNHKLDKYNTFSAHWHKNIELLFCVDGHGKAVVAGETYEWCPGDIIAVNPNEIHMFYTDDAIEYYCLIVTYDFCIENSIDLSTKTLVHLTNDKKIGELFKIAVCDFKSNKIDITKTRIDVLLLLYEFYKKHFEPNGGKEKNFSEIANVINYIYNNYNKNITLDDAARVAGLSKYYFAKKFKKVTGTTFVLFLNRVRCYNATEMIASGISISDASYACGFNDSAFFSRTFKKLLGMKPSSVKKEPVKKSDSFRGGMSE